MPDNAHTVDVRQIAPRDRHPLIFSTFRGLPSGESMQHLEAGPDTWRVNITKTAQAATATDGRCCGSCGGR